jgi:hypothetical protein
VQIHRLQSQLHIVQKSEDAHNDVIATRFSQHVRDQLGRDRGSRLVFFVLSGVKEVRDDGRDSPGRRDLPWSAHEPYAKEKADLASMDHDTQLNQRSVDLTGTLQSACCAWRTA